MRYRSVWRAVVVATTALAVVWALSPVGFAKKPPGVGGGSGPSLAVEVIDLAGNEMWSILEAPGDTVAFRVTVDGVTPSGGELCLTTAAMTTERCEDLSNNGISDDGVSTPYAVVFKDIVDGKRDSEFDGTVRYIPESGDPLSATFELASHVGDYPDCVDEELNETEPGIYEGSFPDGTDCRWHPGLSGVWNATLRASGESSKPTKVFLTLRDHVPGNWCATSDNTPAGFSGRLRDGETVSVELFTPDTGICLRGGAAGETIGVGNPKTFVLSVTGEVTLEWDRENP